MLGRSHLPEIKFAIPLGIVAIAESTTGHLLGSAWWVDQPSLVIIALLGISSLSAQLCGATVREALTRAKNKQPVRTTVDLSLVLLMVSGIATASIPTGPPVWRFLLWCLFAGGTIAGSIFTNIPPLIGLTSACNLLLGVATVQPILEEGLVFLALIAVPTFCYVSSVRSVAGLKVQEVGRSRLWLWVWVAVIIVACALASGWVEWLRVAEAHQEGVGAGKQTLVGALRNLGEYFGLFGSRTIAFSYNVVSLGSLGALLLSGWLLLRVAAARDERRLRRLVRDAAGGCIILNATLILSSHQVTQALLVAGLIIPWTILTLVVEGWTGS